MKPNKEIPIVSCQTDYQFHIGRLPNDEEEWNSFNLELMPEVKQTFPNYYYTPQQRALVCQNPKLKAEKKYVYHGTPLAQELDKYCAFIYKDGVLQAVPINHIY